MMDTITGRFGSIYDDANLAADHLEAARGVLRNADDYLSHDERREIAGGIAAAYSLLARIERKSWHDQDDPCGVCGEPLAPGCYCDNPDCTAGQQ